MSPEIAVLPTGALSARAALRTLKSPRPIDELWQQLENFRVLENGISEEAYSALIRLMTSFVKGDHSLENFDVSKVLETEAVPVAFRESLTQLLDDPAAVQEFERRVAVLKNWIWGSTMQPAMLKNGVQRVLGEEDMNGLKTKIGWIKGQVETSPIENFSNEFHVLSKEIGDLSVQGRLTPEQLLDIVAEFGFGFSTLSLMGQSLWRPRGYAGSFDMMEAIYAFRDSGGEEVMGDDRAMGWNRLLLSTTSAKDVNDRKAIIIEDLLQHRAADIATEEPLKILNFASGPGRLEEDFWKEIESLELNPNIIWECVDGDAQAVEFAASRLQDMPNTSLRHGNVIRVLHSNKLTSQFDEVLTVGLLDYFDDAFTVKALKKFYGMLKPGGAFRIGQFTTGHIDQPFLELTNWHLFRRDEDTMQELLLQAGVPADCIQIKKISPQGPQLVVTAVKPK